MKITNDIVYVGVNDHKVDLFEGQFAVPNGMSYNSYVILDEKIAVMDSVDRHFGDEWLANIKAVLGDRKPDYLIVSHMEPDHSANIARFMEEYPNATVVATAMAFNMILSYFGNGYADRKMVAAEGSSLSLGRHNLTFYTAPLVHWPEVMVTYDSADKVLFSADAFGKFGAIDADEDWADEARRYYIGIVGKFGAQAQALLKKAAGLDISMICPLHGPVLSENIGYYVDLYNTWSSYTPEADGVVIAYTSVYGHTKAAVEKLASQLEEKGCKCVAYDLCCCDSAPAVADAFRYSKLVLATTTYNGGIFPAMREYIEHLTDRSFQRRTVGIIENGSWGPMAAKTVKAMLEPCKDVSILEPTVTIKCAVNQAVEAKIAELCEAIVK